MPGNFPVQDSFLITTPSMSVRIVADDSALPPNVPAQKNSANLVTVSALEVRESRAPISEDSESVAESSSSQPQIFKRLRSKIDENALLSRQAELSGLFMKRSQSKHAEEIYSKPGAPAPVQEIEGEYRQTDDSGVLKRIDTYQTKDFTYWDKLKRKGTQTEIRRWNTYMPEDVEDTAFYGRNFGVDIPSEANDQGIYFEQLENEYLPKEYTLPTTSYVAPAVFLKHSYASRIPGDPIQRMVKRVESLLQCTC